MEYKVVKHIETNGEGDWYDDYSSHRPLLWLAAQRMPLATFYEFGMGNGSTDFLKYHTRKLKSYETDLIWLLKFISGYEQIISPTETNKYQTAFVNREDNHIIFQAKSYKGWQPIDTESVAFIDSRPGEERKDLVGFYADKAKVVILHDTELGAQSIYGITNVLNSFKYRLDYYPEGMPGTTALSNFINVCNWV